MRGATSATYLAATWLRLAAAVLICLAAADAGENAVTEQEAHHIILRTLERYCAKKCELVALSSETARPESSQLEIGFVENTPAVPPPPLETKSLHVTIEVESSVPRSDQDKLTQVLRSRLQSLAPAQITFAVVDPPKIESSREPSVLKQREALEQKIHQAVDAKLRQYCLEDCALERIEFSDDASSDSDSDSAVAVAVQIRVAVNEILPASEQDAVRRILEVATAFAQPRAVFLNPIAFPLSSQERLQRRERQSDDPHGLNKLRDMLTLFRDLAGTKEIISTTENSEKIEQQRQATQEKTETSAETPSGLGDAALPIAAAIFGLMLLVMLRIAKARQDFTHMIQTVPGDSSHPVASSTPERVIRDPSPDPENVTLIFDVEKKKSDLMKILMHAPRVARETFARMLQESGVEETAKYLHLLGRVVIAELTDDPALQRTLYELSDHYRQCQFKFTASEQLHLYERLQTYVTATEVRILARNASQQFEFLAKLSPHQIYTLIEDERPQIQSLVLTQISPQQRRDVFALFTGQRKDELTGELCRVSSLPKEFLHHAAAALRRKATVRPEFNAENVRTSDIILELLERATADEQHHLMANLLSHNPDTARAVKTELVTLESLRFIQAGHVIEILMGLDDHDLPLLLAGLGRTLRDHLLGHAPDELAMTWQEEIEQLGSIPPGASRNVEQKVLSKISNLAHSGQIDLLAINDKIFAAPAQQNTAAEPLRGAAPTSWMS